MRLHRFFVTADLSRPVVSVTDAELCHQLSKVLRLKPADHVILVDGKGNEAIAVIEAIDIKNLRVNIVTLREVSAEPTHTTILCCSILKRENFELVVQKATECGVSEIIPLIAGRTVKTGLKMERLRTIAKEAAEQSGRGKIPVIHEPMEFAKAVQLEGIKIFFHTSEPADSLPIQPFSHSTIDPLNSSTIQPSSNSIIQPLTQSTILFIGPEGGWSDAEAAQAKDAGCHIASLGKLVLRGETAAIVAAYVYAKE